MNTKINPADAGIVQDPRTGLKGIRDRMGDTLWYLGNCRDCGMAMYSSTARRRQKRRCSQCRDEVRRER